MIKKILLIMFIFIKLINKKEKKFIFQIINLFLKMFINIFYILYKIKIIIILYNIKLIQ